MALKPWHKVVTLREDLREGKPLDASEFAVNLEDVRNQSAPNVYRDPRQFFERTYLTKNLAELASQVIRRLSGITTETNAVFNMTTQFGGGKTHALTLLYHLAANGSSANQWMGVGQLLQQAGISTVPHAATAIFVGIEFDTLKGRGGDDGTPRRKTPWGEIAYQLGGEEALAILSEHDKQLTAPGGDVIRSFLPKDKPCLILIDEMMNYISRGRPIGMATQMHNFIQNLTEAVRGQTNAVLAISLPGSELEMSTDDEVDYAKLLKLLNRVGLPIMISAEEETSEIIRRRLFEWDERAVSQEGKVLLSKDAYETCEAYAKWIIENRHQLPEHFPIDLARDRFVATYPFHPSVLSVFERKWRALPSFQQTRGVLRLLALWVSKAAQEDFKAAHKDPLIGLGTAPLEDPIFQSAVFKQLGEDNLEGAVTTDIVGKKDAHAARLDSEAVDTVKKTRLHRKIATVIFFESNGGQLNAQATVPEITLATGEPDVETGHIEPALEALYSTCYYLDYEKKGYRFSHTPNLNKILADRLASVQPHRIEDRVREEIMEIFRQGSKSVAVDIRYFPEKSIEIPDRPVLTLVVLSPERPRSGDNLPLDFIESLTKESGTSARVFKSALLWCVPEATTNLYADARKVLAWQDIRDEDDEQSTDTRKNQLKINLGLAERDLREDVWRTYKNIVLLRKDGQFHLVDLGRIHSSSTPLVVTIIDELKSTEDISETIGVGFLTRNWPPAFKEWSTRDFRDAFFATPRFPRLLKPESLKETIARGVTDGMLGYVGKMPDGAYQPFYFNTPLQVWDVEISEDMFLITKQAAENYIKQRDEAASRNSREAGGDGINNTATSELDTLVITPKEATLPVGGSQNFQLEGLDSSGNNVPLIDVVWAVSDGTISSDGFFTAGVTEGTQTVAASVNGLRTEAIVTVTEAPTSRRVIWSGVIPPQKWMNFYMKVLTRLVSDGSLKLTVSVDAEQQGDAAHRKAEEMRGALRELGLVDDVEVH